MTALCAADMTKRTKANIEERKEIDVFWKVAGLKSAPYSEKRAMILALSQTQTKQ